MLSLTQHFTAAIAAIFIVTATFVPVLTVPPAAAASATLNLA